MERDHIIQDVAESLWVFSVNLIADIFSSPAFGWWAKGQSSRVNVKKFLDALVEQGKLERCDGFYRTKGSRSEYKSHAKRSASVWPNFGSSRGSGPSSRGRFLCPTASGLIRLSC